MKTLEEQLAAAGLVVSGCCERMSEYGVELIQSAPLLEDFTPEEADILGASMLLVRAEPGQVMIREGESGDWMMLVLKGTVDVTKRIELPGQEVAEGPALESADDQAMARVSRLGVIQRGHSVGEMSMLDNEPRYASCIAIEAVEAAVLGRRAVALLIRDHPAVGAKLLVKLTQMMAQRLRNTSNQLVRRLRSSPDLTKTP